jgi:hypothetical protein
MEVDQIIKQIRAINYRTGAAKKEYDAHQHF